MYLTILVFLFYLFWGVISLLAQGQTALNKKIKSRDTFGLIPSYRFFCPEPMRVDYHLYYRHIIKGKITQWKELQLPERNRYISFFWHPEKKERKMYNKIIGVIKKEYGGDSGKRAGGPVYRLLLAYIRRQSDGPETAPLQFRITSRRDYDPAIEETELYLSTFNKGTKRHDLPILS